MNTTIRKITNVIFFFFIVNNFSFFFGFDVEQMKIFKPFSKKSKKKLFSAKIIFFIFYNSIIFYFLKIFILLYPLFFLNQFLYVNSHEYYVTFNNESKKILLGKLGSLPKILNLCVRGSCFTARKENENIEINNCLISIISSIGNGGAIFVNISPCNLLITESTFYQCISLSGHGGAIFFQNGMDILLSKNCAIECKASNDRQFAFLQTSRNHSLFFFSISKCFNQSIKYITLALFGGTQNISQCNISNNKNIRISTIEYYYPYKMDSVLNNFFNNTCSTYRNIFLFGNVGNIYKCNILQNNCPSEQGVVTLWYGVYTFYDCIFRNNYQTLFYVNSGILKLDNCYILHDLNSISTNIGLSPIFSSELYYHTETFQISHYMTQFSFRNQDIICFAENPLPYKTPENSIHPTISDSLFPTFLCSFSPTLSELILSNNNIQWKSIYIYLGSMVILILIGIVIIIYFGNNQDESSERSIVIT